MLQKLIEELHAGETLLPERLYLQLPDYVLGIRSNSAELLQRLADYFAHVLVDGSTVDKRSVQGEVWAIQQPVLAPGYAFCDWLREPGKTGRKDSFIDLAPGVRLLRKVRSGMLFLQSNTVRIASGPCLEYDNQLINFINSQYLNHLQQKNWLLCHAAALSRGGDAVAFAGLSGGGKSSLMLRLMEDQSFAFVSNDRLLVEPGSLLCRGIPKQPRINPGTILHNPRLASLLDKGKAESLAALSPEDLWHLEEKHDAMIPRLYGRGRIVPQARLRSLVILNWQREHSQACELRAVELGQRRDLLAAVMKSAGPFYCDLQGQFLANGSQPAEKAYRDALASLPAYELCGRIDFDRASSLCQQQLQWSA